MIKILRLFEDNDVLKIEKSCNILGLQKPNAKILDEILRYVLESGSGTNKEKVFDYDLDFKYYYADFKELGIDLINEDIDWYKFNSILRKIMLNKSSLLSQIIDFRTYEKPSSSKTAEAKMHKERTRLKNEYRLPQKKNNLDNNFNKMWGFITKKAERGDGSE